jgi:hypothetical protein
VFDKFNEIIQDNDVRYPAVVHCETGLLALQKFGELATQFTSDDIADLLLQLKV